MDPEVVTPVDEAKPWYESRTMIGSVVATIAIIANMAGFQIDGLLETEVADTAFQAVALGGVVYALIGRVLATKKLK